jgi:hypothetical protein
MDWESSWTGRSHGGELEDGHVDESKADSVRLSGKVGSETVSVPQNEGSNVKSITTR